MKFRYYIRGFGAGLIVATAVLLIAGMIEKNNNYIVSDNKETQSSGSVIAFTTESTDNKEKETQKTTGKSDEETTQVNKETTTAVVARETESQRPTASIVIGDGSGLVQIEFKGVGTASEAADILYSAGIIEDKLAFYTYMDISRRIRHRLHPQRVLPRGRQLYVRRLPQPNQEGPRGRLQTPCRAYHLHDGHGSRRVVGEHVARQRHRRNRPCTVHAGRDHLRRAERGDRTLSESIHPRFRERIRGPRRSVHGHPRNPSHRRGIHSDRGRHLQLRQIRRRHRRRKLSGGPSPSGGRRLLALLVSGLLRHPVPLSDTAENRRPHRRRTQRVDDASRIGFRPRHGSCNGSRRGCGQGCGTLRQGECRTARPRRPKTARVAQSGGRIFQRVAYVPQDSDNYRCTAVARRYRRSRRKG